MSSKEKLDKLIERARKLYAMSNDTSSPAEAAIALKRVTSMMETYGITAADLEDNRSEFGSVQGGKRYKAMPTWYGILIVGVARYHDCNVVVTNGRATFEGFDKDAIVAPLTLDYLIQVMERGVKRYQKDQKQNDPFAYFGPSPRQQGSSYRRGYVSEMQNIMFRIAAGRKKEQEEAMEESGGTALVVQKKALVEDHFGMQRIKNAKGVRPTNAAFAGAEGARNTSLNGQVTGSKQGALS